MVQVPESFLWGMATLGVLQLGTLVFFLGRISEKLRIYDGWVSQCEKCSRIVAVLENNAGVKALKGDL